MRSLAQSPFVPLMAIFSRLSSLFTCSLFSIVEQITTVIRHRPSLTRIAGSPIYSRFRESQAANFVRNVNGSSTSPVKQTLPSQPTNQPTSNSSASICVGIASVSRQETNYIESAVGSLLVDLTEEERKGIHLILFIPHTDPTVHPSYSSSWLHAAADTVLLYDLPEEQMKHINKLEQGKGRPKEKALFDYMYLLKACQEVESPYVLMIEDDVVAMDGWYHRTRRALEDAELQTGEIGASQCECFAHACFCSLLTYGRSLPPVILHP